MDKHFLVENVHGSYGEDHCSVFRVSAHLLHQMEKLSCRLVELDYRFAVVAIGGGSDERLHISDRLGVHARERVENHHAILVKEFLLFKEHDDIDEVADVDGVDQVAILWSKPPVFLELQPGKLVGGLHTENLPVAGEHAEHDVEEDLVGAEPDVAHGAGDVVDARLEAVFPGKGSVQLADAAGNPSFWGRTLEQLAQSLRLHVVCVQVGVTVEDKEPFVCVHWCLRGIVSFSWRTCHDARQNFGFCLIGVMCGKGKAYLG